MSNWLNARPQSGNQKAPRLSEQVQLVEFPKNKWVRIRMLGPVHTYAQGWIDIKTKTGKITRIPKICLDYNPDTQSYDDNGCPYRANDVYITQRYLTNVIVRSIQDLEPKKSRQTKTEEESKAKTILGYKAYYKEMSSDSYTPVRVWDMPAGCAEELVSLSATNKVKNKKTGKTKVYDLSDPKHGMDLMVKYNPDAAGPKKWSIQKEERVPLTDDELNYLIFKLNVPALKPESLKTAKKEWEKLQEILYTPKKDKNGRILPADQQDDEDEEEKPKKKKKKSVIEEDDDDAPWKDKKKKKKKLGKKKKKDDDEDDDDLEDLSD